MNFLGNIHNNSPALSIFPSETCGAQLLPEQQKNRITKARERNWERLLEQGPLKLVLLHPLISLATVKSSILNHTLVWPLYVQSDLVMSLCDERKEESERGSYKGEKQIITQKNYGELPTSHYCFKTWQKYFLGHFDQLISPHSFYPHLIGINTKTDPSKQCKNQLLTSIPYLFPQNCLTVMSKNNSSYQFLTSCEFILPTVIFNN